MTDADAKQTYFPTGRQIVLEQFFCRGINFIIQVGGGGQRLLAGERGKVLIAQFDLHINAHQVRLTHTVADLIRESAQGREQLRQVGGIPGESDLVADGFNLAPAVDR